jgi:hypothetical protein
MKIRIKQILILTILIAVFLPASGQEDRFKEFAENHKVRTFCFYPSTLRMLNIGGNPDFDKMVSGIEKLLVYKLDSISRADRLYNPILDTYRESGYEEYITIFGGDKEVYVLGSGKYENNEFIGIVMYEQNSIAFLLKGNIGWEELPKIFNNIKDGDFINILNLNTEQFD